MPILWWNQLDFGWRHLPDCSNSRREWPKNYRLEMPIIFFFFYITLSNGQQLKKWLWYIAAHRVQVANTIYNSIYSDCIPLIDVVYLGFFFSGRKLNIRVINTQQLRSTKQTPRHINRTPHITTTTNIPRSICTTQFLLIWWFCRRPLPAIWRWWVIENGWRARASI